MAEEDLIFGKMRHLFGGIEPSNMENFAVTVENGSIKITAQLPSDTIVEDQTLCTVAGAVIRRKSAEYPKDEFDGDFVADIKKSGTIIDSDANSTATYYYTAFPYSTKGVYNRNSINQKVKAPSPNRAAINEPEPMVMFSAKSADSVIKITAELPSTAAGAVIRKSTGGYPASPEYGDEFITITSNGTYIDSDVIAGLTYYYTAFPYTSSGEYSINILNRASAIAKSYNYLFGYDLDTTDSNPNTRVTYPSDVDNANYIAASVNSSGMFNYGSWPSTPGEKFMPKPCMLNYDGTVAYYLNPNNYAYKEDGITASDIVNTSFEGNAMMEWPKIYTKRWEENGIYHFRCSDRQIEKDWECWCNYDINNNEIDHFYTAIYNGSLISNKLRSMSGTTTLTSMTFANYITYAAANSGDWCIDVISDRFLIQDLLVMMSKSTDTQMAYGAGAYTVINGGGNASGMFYSDPDNNILKVFGMENVWGGETHRSLAGLIIDNNVYKVKLTRGTHDGSTVTEYNATGDGYITTDCTIPTLSSSTGYINEMNTQSFGRLPINLEGSSTTYESDELCILNDTVAYPGFGGRAGLEGDGVFALGFYATESATRGDYCSSLSCKPSVSI